MEKMYSINEKGILVPDKEIAEICRKATIDAFRGKIDKIETDNFLNAMYSDSLRDTPSAIEADASLVSAVLWSKVTCEPKNQPWVFKESAWGPGIGGGSCVGFMYTAYTDPNGWDNFFKNVTAYHAQGLAATGGIFQINWFNSSGTPVGQFNGALAGAGAFEIGGSCKWERK